MRGPRIRRHRSSRPMEYSQTRGNISTHPGNTHLKPRRIAGKWGNRALRRNTRRSSRRCRSTRLARSGSNPVRRKRFPQDRHTRRCSTPSVPGRQPVSASGLGAAPPLPRAPNLRLRRRPQCQAALSEPCGGWRRTQTSAPTHRNDARPCPEPPHAE
jgi:hypothetical protein